jgi:hypothetical protein
MLTAGSIAGTRAPTKTVIVRGTVVAIGSGIIVIADAAGTRHTIRLSAGVRPQLHGKPAPSAALFPGAKATVRGTESSGTLIASFKLSVSTRTVSGRIVTAGHTQLTVRERAGRLVKADVPAGLGASDGSKKLPVSAIHPGAYVRIVGYVESATALRATKIALQHPGLDVSGTLVSTGTTFIVQTSSGERFGLRLSAKSQIIATRIDVALQPADLPVGAHVHVQGTVDSVGLLAVETLTVRLSAVTIRGRLAAVAGQSWLVQTGSTSVKIRLQPSMPVAQGSHTLTATDVVVGDDITVYGYALGAGSVLARKVLVHRKRVGVDGTVSALTAEGFTLSATDGDHHVLTSAATAVTGSGLVIASGLRVHVTGYLRGDGAILATRVRIGKKP